MTDSHINHHGCRVSRLHPDGAPASPFIKRSLPVASVVRAPSEPPSAPEAAAESSAKQKLAPGLHSLAASKKQAEPEESFGGVPLEAYFRQTSIAAHRPPHIPIMRTVAEVGSEDPRLAPVSSLETSSSVGSLVSNITNVQSLDVKWDVTTSKFVSSAPGSLSHREISQFVKQRLEGPAPGAQDTALSVDMAVGDRIRAQLRTLYRDSLNIKKAERIAAARASLMSMPESERAKINPFRSDNSLSLGARSGSFGTDVPKIQKRASVRLVGPVVEEAGPAMDPALPCPKAPEPSHLLAEMEPLPRWGPGPVAESISDDEEVAPVSSMAALDEVPTEQIAEAPTAATGSRRATHASGGWGFDWLLKRWSKDRASRVKSRGSLMPRRWSSVQVKCRICWCASPGNWIKLDRIASRNNEWVCLAADEQEQGRPQELAACIEDGQAGIQLCSAAGEKMVYCRLEISTTHPQGTVFNSFSAYSKPKACMAVQLCAKCIQECMCQFVQRR